jgi:CDP-4-dehydro-6-deoxyglucose reductase, E1
MRFPLMRNNITREDLDALISHLQQEDPKLTHGPQVATFEREWSNWLGVKHSVFVNSGASANLLSMEILRLLHPEGGEVVVPALTWISDIASVLQCGFTPVFADIDPTTLSMCTPDILDRLTPKTRAVFLTHTQGFNGLTNTLLAELKSRNIPLIEDVCESHGATHCGQKLGSFGWMSNFSFYYAHHMSTIEGGMVCTNDDETYQRLRMLRSHGLVRESTDETLKDSYSRDHPDLNPDFIFAFPAYNLRPTELGGILGRSQLKRLDTNNAKRTLNFSRFLAQINPVWYRTDFAVAGSSNYAFNLVLRQPDMHLAERLMAHMRKHGIEFRRGSAGGGNQLRQPYLTARLGKEAYSQVPEVDHVHFFGFYLGNYPDMTFDEVDEICGLLNEALL